MADCKFSFPIQTNGGLLTLPGDTVTFAYDAFGNLLRADNKSARIRRSYTPGGLLVTDSSFVRTLRYATEGSSVPANDFTSHKYGITYGYDGAGRLDSLWHPDVLDPCSGPCPAQRYAYDTTTGRLSSLVDVRGKTFTFRYTDAGQLRALVYPGNTLDTTTYDAEGRVFKRRVMDAGGFAFIADSLQYDPMGRVITGTGRVLHTGDPQTLLNVYGGLGPLVATEHYINGATPTTYEEFQYDALANQFWSRRSGIHLGGSADEPSIRDHHYDAEGRVTDVQPEDTLLLDDYDWHHYWYDAEGRTTFTTDRVDVGAATPNQEAHYYDGEGRLVLLERHHGWSVDTLYSDANEPEALSEWYRYDALGRRVLVFTHHEKMRSCTAEGCESTLSRYVWAGDQLLYETRAAAADSITSSNVETDTPGGDGEYGSPKAYGTVGYTHAGGIDRPLGVLRMDNGGLTTAFYPQLNWRGLYETATTDTGTEFHSRDFIKWPGAVASAYLGANTKPDSAFWWYGSQITESADASGLMYRRNRYYDPASGRFTQPDPAGIGGGLNSYGFGGGDPVNYTDPFGLCGHKGEKPCDAAVVTTLSAPAAGIGAGDVGAATAQVASKVAVGASVAYGAYRLGKILITPAFPGSDKSAPAAPAGAIAQRDETSVALPMGDFSRRVGGALVGVLGWLGGFSSQVGVSDHTNTGAGGPTSPPTQVEEEHKKDEKDPRGAGSPPPGGN